MHPGINIIHTCEPPRTELPCCAAEPDLSLNLIHDDPARVSFLHQTPTPVLVGPAVTSCMEWGLLKNGPKVISLEEPAGLPFMLTPLGKVVRQAKGREFTASLLACYLKMADRPVNRRQLFDAASTVKSQRLAQGVASI